MNSLEKTKFESAPCHGEDLLLSAKRNLMRVNFYYYWVHTLRLIWGREVMVHRKRCRRCCSWYGWKRHARWTCTSWTSSWPTWSRRTWWRRTIWWRRWRQRSTWRSTSSRKSTRSKNQLQIGCRKFVFSYFLAGSEGLFPISRRNYLHQCPYTKTRRRNRWICCPKRIRICFGSPRWIGIGRKKIESVWRAQAWWRIAISFAIPLAL